MCRRLVQIFGCVLATVGWAFVASTLAMDYWRVSQTGDQGGSAAIGVAWYWSSLWKDCYVNSVAVVNCVDFEVLWSVESYVQGVRGLLITGLTLSLLATAFSIVGLECTVIGGDKRNNDRMLLTAAVLHFVGGVSDIAGYCLYINSVVSTVVHGGILSFSQISDSAPHSRRRPILSQMEQSTKTQVQTSHTPKITIKIKTINTVQTIHSFQKCYTLKTRHTVHVIRQNRETLHHFQGVQRF
ncbi:claudin-10-like [Chanos chanos]|uniref:Claudin-10-like n=1 Tax=Chanos chanos TaxID=29144 RepID=A0A6J2VZW8_CHACN|nr:claudin-10-like [Chanos chanos]